MTYTTDELNEMVEFADEFLSDKTNQVIVDSGWDDLLRAEIDEYAGNYFNRVDDELFEKLVLTVRHRSKLEARK